jgi:hypothetical protein
MSTGLHAFSLARLLETFSSFKLTAHVWPVRGQLGSDGESKSSLVALSVLWPCLMRPCKIATWHLWHRNLSGGRTPLAVVRVIKCEILY